VRIREALDLSVEARSLLQHPFYQAWRAGTLPQEALAAYAREYGAFIASLPDGWLALDDPETADEEREHAEMWDDFARALGTEVGRAGIQQVRALMDEARTLFAEPATAAGALYAFERQQPATATSKLAGLRSFYGVGPAAERYFEVHTRNQHEAEKLAARIETMGADDRQRALRACDAMGAALWDALTGIHAGACPAA
jgi:pyrroloquinoline-quinone synthase